MKGRLLVLVSVLLTLSLFLDTANGQVGAKKKKPGKAELAKIWTIFKHIDSEMNPKILRLAFHQCVGESCNACVDTSHPENQGFKEVIHLMHQLHNRPDIFPYMTMSDLIAFALLSILNKRIFMNNINCTFHKYCAIPTPDYEYYWGRKDECNHIGTKIDNTPNDFPTALMNRTEMMAWFEKDFGYNEAEVTLLLGAAHAMGGSHKEHSHYTGNFTKPGNYGRTFNNNVFERLTLNVSDIRLRANYPDSNVQKFFQFEVYGHRGGLKGAMLNSEVVAMYDIELDPLEGTKCKFNDVVFTNTHDGERYRYNDPDMPYCKKSSTWDVAYHYATNATAFSEDFFKLFNRMVSKGHEGKLEKLDLPYIRQWKWEDFRDKDWTRPPKH